jgi:hypothetical protein
MKGTDLGLPVFIGQSKTWNLQQRYIRYCAAMDACGGEIGSIVRMQQRCNKANPCESIEAPAED